VKCSLTRGVLIALASTLFASPAAAQSATRTGLNPPVQAGIAFVSTLIIGAMLLSNLEGYTARVAKTIRNDPLESLIIGIGVLVGFIVLVFLCALLGVVGVLLLVVLVFGFAFLSIAANAIAYMTVFAPYVGRLPSLVFAALVAAAFGYLPAVGGTTALVGRIVSFLLGAVGLGAMTIVYRS
jgi:hypothetical protein